MGDVFISYARPTERQAATIAGLLRARGFNVWRDDDIPPHRPFGDVIEERLGAARAVLVLWSEAAAQSHWVRAEAEHGRMAGKLVQLSLDGAPLPMPFSQIQCEELTGWTGDPTWPGLVKVLKSLAELVGGRDTSADGAIEVAAPLPVGGGPARLHVGLAASAGELAEDVRTDLAAALGGLPDLIVVPGLKVPPDFRIEVQAKAAGERLRATIRLLSQGTGEQLWSERFDGATADPFAWQDRLVETVAANVEAIVRRARISRAAGRSTEEIGARRLAAAAAINRMTEAGYREGLADLAPDTSAGTDADALALAAIAAASLWVGGYAGTGEPERAAATAHAQAALGLTDSAAFPVGLSAVALALAGRPIEPSLALVERVQALTPGFAPALLWAGQLRLIGGDVEAATERLEAARRLDPRMAVRPLLLGYLGAARMLAGALAEARGLLLEAGDVTDALPMNNLFLAATLGLLGDRAGAAEALAVARRVAPPADFRLPLAPAHRARLDEGLSAAGG